jgi:hypothetical protein
MTAAVAALANQAEAQVVPQKTFPGGVQPPAGQPKITPGPKPVPPPQAVHFPGLPGKKPNVYTMPSINSWPGIPVSPLSQTVWQPPFWNPAIDNPWMNRTTINSYPIGPFNNPFNNPFVINPLLANPVVINPLIQTRNQFNPFGIPPYRPRYDHPEIEVQHTPAQAVQEPGMLLYKGPDLQVNPWSGTEYHPVSGTVTLADGSTFYRVAGSGLPTAFGTYASGSGLYYNPIGGTFFNPSSGTLSKPAQTNIFMPYVW